MPSYYCDPLCLQYLPIPSPIECVDSYSGNGLGSV
ncbi:hypothetical protein CGLO_10636 [Colletotrichum gloeosporioides Cg-14]|uniref:Uncharacterized protein n=1 Tax=Colletotrichum gloeosporioides (strain Cg-14) TaxID=1237896 RepID=T0KD51_COLGC|nr:hypothetical protein CGLO_10636 [Colletotrichum gloeosporioides Cg-14]